MREEGTKRAKARRDRSHLHQSQRGGQDGLEVVLHVRVEPAVGKVRLQQCMCLGMRVRELGVPHLERKMGGHLCDEGCFSRVSFSFDCKNNAC